MKQFSRDQQVINCLLALSLWAEIPPRSVDLKTWRCGTKACFGGHLATWPEFQAMGVKPNFKGAPMARGAHCPGAVADHLFGDGSLFSTRAWVDFEEVRMTHHAAIVHRLEKRIEELTS